MNKIFSLLAERIFSANDWNGAPEIALDLVSGAEARRKRPSSNQLHVYSTQQKHTECVMSCRYYAFYIFWACDDNEDGRDVNDTHAIRFWAVCFIYTYTIFFLLLLLAFAFFCSGLCRSRFTKMFPFYCVLCECDAIVFLSFAQNLYLEYVWTYFHLMAMIRPQRIPSYLWTV